MFSLKIWRHHLYGSTFIIFSDHKSLQCLFDQKELNMRQLRWIETLKDYDFRLQYHAGKANIVADALRRQNTLVSFLMVKEQELLEKFRDLNLNVEFSPGELKFSMINPSNGLIEDIQKHQFDDELLQQKRHLIMQGNALEFKVGPNNIMHCNGCLCILAVDKIKEIILEEAHISKLSFRPGVTKI
ncbi:uncharacterized protein [Cicer arietinum]|uniref:Uncharacterized protein LOC113787755 n=1 Tax=Cicer arietinum TaxID=3827 RepID=A0A3Q7YGR6_CICAR|nr:uncharacterized protein LOC113787755 [Cicer arietinum]